MLKICKQVKVAFNNCLTNFSKRLSISLGVKGKNSRRPKNLQFLKNKENIEENPDILVRNRIFLLFFWIIKK
jgi:hypothetical protein